MNPLGLLLGVSVALSATPDRLRWWQQFDDPVLERLISRAARSSSEVRLAAARLEEAEAQRSQSAAEQLPSLGLAASGLRVRGFYPGSGGGSPGAFLGSTERTFVQGSAEQSWSTDLFGSRRLATAAGRADRDAAAAHREDVELRLVSEVGRAYLEHRANQQKLKLAREEAAALAEAHEIARKQFAAGLVSELAVAAARRELALAQASLSAKDAAVRQPLLRLATLTGMTVEALEADLTEPGAVPKPLVIADAEFYARQLERRPDVRRAKSQLEAALWRKKSADRERLPQLSLVGTFGRLASNLPGLLLGVSNTFSFGPGLRFPLFDGGRLKANFRVRTAQERQAAILLEETTLRAVAEVKQAQTEIARGHNMLLALRDAEQTQKREAALAEALFKGGLEQWKVVLEQRRRGFAIREQQVQAEADLGAGSIRLYEALGGAL
jgi:NodT family efflux transporter outer membrane factor (OMF) lipoprotein